MGGRLSRRALMAAPAGLLPAAAISAEPVVIYAAMTFRAGLDAVLAAYGGGARAVYGPTPALVQQIEQGAPADIFFSADPSWMDEAARRKLIRVDTRVNVMANGLVMVGPKSDEAVAEIDRAYPIAALVGKGRIAMCDPQNDPAGRYARASLESLGLWSAMQGDIAVAENTLGAVVLVDRGEAAAAVVFSTDIRGAANVRVIGALPENSHPPIVYPAAMTARTANADAAKALGFLTSSTAQAIFRSFGYRALPG